MILERLAKWLGATQVLDDKIRSLENKNYELEWTLMNTTSALKEQLRSAEFHAREWERYAKKNDKNKMQQVRL